jgi:hypothetical protein
LDYAKENGHTKIEKLLAEFQGTCFIFMLKFSNNRFACNILRKTKSYFEFQKIQIKKAMRGISGFLWLQENKKPPKIGTVFCELKFSYTFILLFTVKQIDWKSTEDSDWAPKCDFKAGDLQSQAVPTESCTSVCVSTPGCTHFTWTDFSGGTCWMKSGPVKKEEAFPINSASAICGIVKLCEFFSMY